MEEGTTPVTCPARGPVDVDGVITEKSLEFLNDRGSRDENENDEKSVDDVFDRKDHDDDDAIDRKSLDDASSPPRSSLDATNGVVDAFSVDSASSIGGVSWEISEGAIRFALGSSEDGVSSDSGRMTIPAEEKEGVKSRACNGVNGKSDANGSSPESGASSNDEAFSKDESPNRPCDGLPSRPRRRTVSFIEDHRPSTSGADDASLDGQDSVDAVPSRDSSTTASGDAESSSAIAGEPKMFRVKYLGNTVMDRRYPTDLQPWVMAELRRMGTTTPVVLSAISGGSVLHGSPRGVAETAPEPIFLRAVSEMDSSILFELDMSCISRFVRLHTDKLCFAFMSKNPQNVDMPYACFVFLGYNEDVVPAIFNLVRKCALISSSSADIRLRSGSCSRESEVVGDGSVPSRPISYDNFEVQFRGRLRISGHKGPDSLIDDCVAKLESKLEKKRAMTQLQQQPSADGERTPEPSSEAPKSRLSVAEMPKRRRSGMSNESASIIDHQALQPSDPVKSPTRRHSSTAGDETDGRSRTGSSVYEPRAIIFQVGVLDILITDPTTGSVEAKNYEQISKCQTGLQAVDHFGFIWREASISSSPSGSIKREYYVYVFKGASEQVVNEIMLKLHQSFTALHAQRSQARAVTCELCPMHQLHKLCREIEGLEAEKAIGILVQRIEAQDEEDVQIIVTRYKKESPKPNDPQDHLEVLMSVLRHVCQQKQVHHVHIAERRESAFAMGSQSVHSSASSANVKESVQSSDFILDAPARRISTADKVTHFFKRTSKKSLLASFEQLVKGGDGPLEEESASSRSSSRRPSIQLLHSMTDSISKASDTGDDAQWGPFKGASPVAGRDGAKDGTPFSAKPALSPKSRPRSKTLGQLPTMPMRLKRDSSSAVDPTPSTTTTTTIAESANESLSPAMSEAQFEFTISPKKKMFSRIGHPGSGLGRDDAEPSSRKSSASEAPEATLFLDETPPKRRDNSWRQSLYRHVVTPGKGSDTDSDLSRRGSLDPAAAAARFSASASSSRRPSANVEGLTWMTSPASTPTSGLKTSASAAQIRHQQQAPESDTRRRSSEELRDLWRSAITQQILLNKMERQNSQLAESQDKAVLKRERLLYEELTPCLKRVTADWDQALLSGSTALPHNQLRDLVRRGVPRAKRGAIWKYLIQQEASKPFRPPKEAVADPNVDVDRPFDELLNLLTIHQHAILIDLARTFPNHPYFNKQLGPGQLSLFNLLKAYSIIDSNVGYCQGLSFVAGILLMHLEEEESFDAMKFLLIKTGLRAQYCPEMTALQVQMYQLSRLIHDHHPQLSKKLESFEMSPTLFAASWFLTLFASQFPLGFVARVFDLVFLEGIQAIFKVAVALLGQHLPLIIECDSFESLVEFLKNTLPALSKVQMERVIAEAFELEEDISKHLNAYQIEYHIFQDELTISPGGSTGHTTLGQKVKELDEMDAAARNIELEKSNRKLKQQNYVLLEQLQTAQATIDHYANMVKELGAKVAAMEQGLETSADESADWKVVLNNNKEFQASVG